MEKTGGQAFPRPMGHSDKEFNYAHFGMTLRDYLVAHAPKTPSWFKPIFAKNQKELDEYDLEYKKEVFFQWQEYYADKIIQRRV